MVRADDLFLPKNGTSQSEIVFTWFENDKTVAGKTVNFGLDGTGTLDKPMAVTDGSGRATVKYAPTGRCRPATARRSRGAGRASPTRRFEIKYGAISVDNLAVYSKADRGGDRVGLVAVISSNYNTALRDVPVEFYDGNPATGGKLIDKRTIPNLPGERRCRHPLRRTTWSSRRPE